MAKYTNEQLAMMAKPASETEETKLTNAHNTVLNALAASNILDSSKYEIFGQGSYANNTNIRNNSDIDINVCYTDAFYFDLPAGVTRESYGLNNPAIYTFKQYKTDIFNMLQAYFGEDQVVRKNKCIHIKKNTYHTDIDVVPTWKYRKYSSIGVYSEGVKLYPDDNSAEVINFPKQHLRNGVDKNSKCSRRYKRLVRIVKNLKIRMEDSGYYQNDNVTSFLLECLTYNYPNYKFRINEVCDWNAILKDYISYFYHQSKQDDTEWQKWLEASELLKLMVNHKWNRNDVNTFLHKLWNFLEY